MTLDELLESLRARERDLYSRQVQDFYQRQPEEVRHRFVLYRQEVTFIVEKLTNAQLAIIARKLDELSPDLNAGINNLQEKITELNDAVAILNALGTVLGLAARIAALALG